jgi:DNA-nicking Smr family endonuclease
MARRRSLHPDEQALWQAVAKTARPMRPARAQIANEPPPPVMATAETKVPPPPIPMFTLGERARTSTAHRTVTNLSEGQAQAPLQMDAKAFGKMTRGKLAPEARIDLHGMTLAEAHPELIAFILNAAAAGLRLVLVITGKGKPKPDYGPIPHRVGVLRHQVPQWLRLAPLGPVVLQVAEAHLRHGGSGAFYVYLRRR